MSLEQYRVQNTLPINNPKNLKYGKVKGMYLLKKYLPKINLISNVTIINSIEEWDKIKGQLADRIMVRTDNPIGEKTVRIEGASGKKEDVPMILEEIKLQNPNAVILLIQGAMPTYPRYKNLGGFTISFDMNESINMNLVGKGFDGRELTRGIVTHESYTIPWDEILWVKDKYSLLKNKFVSKSKINNEDYLNSREERIKFLIEAIKENQSFVQENVPLKYKEIEDDIIKQLLDEVVLPLYTKSEDLHYDGLKHFKVQGNISPERKLIPFEIFTPERIDKTQYKQFKEER